MSGAAIRERRTLAGMRQAELARRVGISAAYLSLIEHDRRAIGGKLLGDVARALGVEPGTLSEGADGRLVEALRDVEAEAAPAPRALEPAEDFAARFPGWAALLAARQERVRDLERLAQTLSDRATHDPALADALHDLLTTASAIGSAAEILSGSDDVEERWRERFQRNIREDSLRLADATQALASRLGDPASPGSRSMTPEEEFDAWLDARGHHVAELERASPAPDEALFRAEPGIEGAAARALAGAAFARYRADAAAMPLAGFRAEAEACGYDPARLAERFGTGFASVLRRLASLPRVEGKGRIGLAVCDNAGVLTYRKPLGGFAMPRHGSGCPFWPLYRALTQPMAPLRAVIETAGRDSARYLAYAVAAPAGAVEFDRPPALEATMLLLPVDLVALPDAPVQVVGTNCRMFPCPSCQASRRGGR